MKSTVWFASLRARSDQESTEAKVRRLYDAAGIPECIHKNDRTAIKLHFGERGNDSYISPVYVRQIVEKLKSN
ncbi:MAG: 4Fe-4S ferredoxin, partial [Methanoregula sp.]|nr:4Fe-4S ferredoxin [Methanoregula sp.]